MSGTTGRGRPARPGVALVLDHVEAITTRDCHDILTELALRLPAGWQLAMASRQALPIRVARLRVQGSIAEIGAQDLAMGPDEAALMFEGTGLRPAKAVPELVKRIEGWPVGLYLAGLALTMWPLNRETVIASDESRRFLGRVPTIRVRQSDVEHGDIVPHPHVDTRPHVRSLVRRHRGHHRLGRRPRTDGEPESVGGPARPSPAVVPIPPPVPGTAGHGTAASRARAHPGAASQGGGVAGRERHARTGDRARSRGRGRTA